MTNAERILANNAELREAIEMAEKLPEAGTIVEAILQSKVVIPSKIAQEITADADYTALEKVTVEAIPDEYIVPSGTNNITENGTHDVTEYAAVKVAVPTGEDVTTETNEYTAKLATLETAITALETELEGKAAGGGTTVEAWTGTVTSRHLEHEYTIHYTDDSLNHRTATVIGFTQDATITIAAGTLIYAAGAGDVFGDNFVRPIEDDYNLLLPTADNFEIEID